MASHQPGNEPQEHGSINSRKEEPQVTEHVEVQDVIEHVKETVQDLEELLVDLEEYAKLDKVPPKAKRYLIRIDKTKYEVNVPEMTGKEILNLARKTPPENYLLTQKFRGGQTKKIDLGDNVDFTTPGVERFMTLPLDQQEG